MQSPHSHKFRVAIAMLVGIAIGAVVVGVIASQATNTKPVTVAWSSWRPSDGGELGAREIADHVAPAYRISGTDQLDVVTVINLSLPSLTAAVNSTLNSYLQVAVRLNPRSSQLSLLGGDTIAYNLCGLGTTDCAIGPGQPSAERLLLLRREALELALYTFRYLKGIQNVVTILPPGHTIQTSSLTLKPPSPSAKPNDVRTSIALLFFKPELAPWLSQPLRLTLAPFPPTVPQLPLWTQTEEAGAVSQITAAGLFTEKVVQAQDGSHLIVLDPQPPQ